MLDSSVIRTIANHAFDYEDSSPPPPRPYLADPLRVLLTVSNLRGVPYRITFENGQSIGYEMMLHADYMDFALGSQADSAPPSVVRLAPRGYRDEQTAGPWRKLAEAAVATGAFPIGLAPEQLDRKATDYLHRLAVMPSFPPELMEYQFGNPSMEGSWTTSLSSWLGRSSHGRSPTRSEGRSSSVSPTSPHGPSC